jgi:uncharacterized protein YgiM (DUF1202 family)
MGKMKKFIKNLFSAIIFVVVGIIGFVIFMLLTEGEQIDRADFSKGFVKQTLNIREGAGTNYDVIKSLSPGDKFYVAYTLDNG